MHARESLFNCLQATLAEWQTVFWVCAGVYCFGATVFCLFASADEQSWAKGEELEEEQQRKGKHRKIKTINILEFRGRILSVFYIIKDIINTSYYFTEHMLLANLQIQS